eukprot:m.1825 g.1825  ORF g.1825 m.1825 type:complete len:238 (-) comp829_c0_seq1:177-890(-)
MSDYGSDTKRSRWSTSLTDTTYSVCWRLLKELDLSQEVVHLPEVEPINVTASFGSDCHDLFLRECWKQLYVDVWSIWEQGITPIVCGSCGVGKSRFMLYFLARTIQERRAARIVLDNPFKFGNNLMYLLEDGYVSKCPRRYTDGCDLYLFDAGGTKYENMLEFGRNIVFSLPDRDCHLLATKTAHRYVFLPPYTLPELHSIASLPYFKHAAQFVEPLFNIYGGIARTVVNKPTRQPR